MSHLDPEQLALLALGEPVASVEESAHLAACPSCAAEVTQMAHAVGVARSTIDDSELEAPPSRVWSAIVSELGLSRDLATDPSDGEPSAAEPSPRRTRTARARRHRSSRAVWTLAASLAVIVAISAGVWTTAVSLRPSSVAVAALDAFPNHPGAGGSAEVDESRDGTRTLRVSVDDATDSDDYREVWLIRSDAAALISLGVLEGTSGKFPIPAGVDLDEYDLVDISLEPIDGDPGHSGDSIVRGRLTSA